MRKNGSSDLVKFEAEGQEFVKSLRSLEQFFLTVGQNNFGNKIPLSPTSNFLALEPLSQAKKKYCDMPM